MGLPPAKIAPVAALYSCPLVFIGVHSWFLPRKEQRGLKHIPPCPNGVVAGKIPGMVQDANNRGLKVLGLNTDKIFLMVNDPLRRSVIRSLADGSMKVAADLGGPSGGRRHNKLKHIAALCKAGILVQKENPQDARAPLYALSPMVDVRKENNVLIVDFGRYRTALD